MSYTVDGQQFGLIPVVPHPKKTLAVLPKGVRVINFCYYCQQRGVLHRCIDYAYIEKRYVGLPDGSIQFVCGRDRWRIPKDQKEGFLPLTIMEIHDATRASA